MLHHGQFNFDNIRFLRKFCGRYLVDKVLCGRYLVDIRFFFGVNAHFLRNFCGRYLVDKVLFGRYLVDIRDFFLVVDIR